MPDEQPSLPTVSPLALRLRLDGADRTIDLSTAPCPRLARQFLDAVRENLAVRSALAWKSVHQDMVPVRKFLRYVQAVEAENAPTVDIGDLEPDHLDGFEQALKAEYGARSRYPSTAVAVVVRLLRVPFERHPDWFEPEFADRLGFSVREHQKRFVCLTVVDWDEQRSAAVASAGTEERPGPIKGRALRFRSAELL